MYTILGLFLPDPDDRCFIPDWRPPWLWREVKAKETVCSCMVPMTICPDGTYSLTLPPSSPVDGSGATYNGLPVRQIGPTCCFAPAPDYLPGD